MRVGVAELLSPDVAPDVAPSRGWESPRLGMPAMPRGKRTFPERHASPGVGVALNRESATDAPDPASFAGLSPRFRHRRPPQEGALPHTVSSMENALAVKPREQGPADAEDRALRRRNPLHIVEGAMRWDPGQTSEGVKTALSTVTLLPQPPAGAHGARPLQVMPPWGDDAGDTQLHKLSDVAKSAMQALSLRINADKLHLRGLDMQCGFLGSGLGMGPGGVLPRATSPLRRLEPQQSGAAIAGPRPTLEVCKDQFAGDVAALVGNVAYGKIAATAANLGNENAGGRSRRCWAPSAAAAPPGGAPGAVRALLALESTPPPPPPRWSGSLVEEVP